MWYLEKRGLLFFLLRDRKEGQVVKKIETSNELGKIMVSNKFHHNM